VVPNLGEAGVGHHRSYTRYGMEIVDIGLQVEVREEEVALDIELAHLTRSRRAFARAGTLKQGNGEKSLVATLQHR